MTATAGLWAGTARGTAPAYPAGCDDAFDGFVFSGQKSALGGSAVQGESAWSRSG